jgi:hypothetical protein
MARLNIRLGDLEHNLSVYVANYLPLTLLLGTSFQRRYVSNISWHQICALLVDCSRVYMIDVTTDKVAVVRDAHQAYLAPMSETIVRCRTD